MGRRHGGSQERRALAYGPYTYVKKKLRQATRAVRTLHGSLRASMHVCVMFVQKKPSALPLPGGCKVGPGKGPVATPPVTHTEETKSIPLTKTHDKRERKRGGS